MEDTGNVNKGKLPDLEKCQAKEMIPDFSECLVENPFSCPFVLPFGSGFLCRHPKHKEIVEQTKQKRLAK